MTLTFEKKVARVILQKQCTYLLFIEKASYINASFVNCDNKLSKRKFQAVHEGKKSLHRDKSNSDTKKITR